MIKKSTSLKTILRLGKKCKQCGHCCSHGSGFILKDEIKKIAKKFKIEDKDFIRKYLKKTVVFNTPVYKFRTKKSDKPYGECIFLEENKCRIQSVKPLHCRIGNCNEHGEELSAWFTVNYLVNKADPESIRQFNLYIKSGGKIIPGGKLQDLVSDKKILKKILNYQILK